MNASVAWFLFLFSAAIVLLGPRYGADSRDGADRSALGRRRRP
ncbi:hypothetical protein [Embleya scabrispora]|nr:hypothetical protein [Embleya scabrispora]